MSIKCIFAGLYIHDNSYMLYYASTQCYAMNGFDLVRFGLGVLIELFCHCCCCSRILFFFDFFYSFFCLSSFFFNYDYNYYFIHSLLNLWNDEDENEEDEE